MSEVRIDPLSGYRVIVATGVDSATPGPARPSEGAGGALAAAPFEPVLTPDPPEPEPTAHPDLFWAGAGTGVDELIEAEAPVSSIGELPVGEAIATVDGWRERMRAHPDASCLHLYADERRGVRASARLLAMGFVPAAIARERERFRGYATRTMGGNLLADLLQQEVRLRERIVAIDSEAVLLSAYAARVPYQLMLVPRTPRMRFEDDGPTGAALLHAAIGRLAAVLGSIPPLSLWVRTAPQGSEHFCWRIDLMPQLPGEREGGLELGAGLTFNPVSPEAAATALRDGG